MSPGPRLPAPPAPAAPPSLCSVRLGSPPLPPFLPREARAGAVENFSEGLGLV